MPSLDCSCGVLAPGIRRIGLERGGYSGWAAWCEFAPGQVRHFEFADGPLAQQWLSFVLINQHGFERKAAQCASQWLFESVER